MPFHSVFTHEKNGEDENFLQDFREGFQTDRRDGTVHGLGIEYSIGLVS